jgi:hypothetical protein
MGGPVVTYVTGKPLHQSFSEKFHNRMITWTVDMTLLIRSGQGSCRTYEDNRNAVRWLQIAD